MKTAISLPDDLFAQAEKLAEARGMSRSELYATALREYVEGHRRDGLIERINEACEAVDSALSSDLASVSRRRLAEVEW